MTDRARAWLDGFTTTQKMIMAVVGALIAAFSAGAGVTTAAARVTVIPDQVRRHDQQLQDLAAVPGAIDSLRAEQARIRTHMARTDSAVAAHDRYITYLACRERRADRGLSLEYCEAFISPADFVSPLGR